jgi:hypothetical protein
MAYTAALKAAQTQLGYWENELKAASQNHDQSRIMLCERFIAQCELMVSALTHAMAGDPKRQR